MGTRAIIILGISIIIIIYSIRKPHVGLLFFILITYIRPERFSYNQLASFRIPLVLAICILIGYLLHSKDYKSTTRINKTLLCLFGMGIFQLLSSTYAVYSSELSFSYTEITLKIAMFCFLLTRLIDSEKRFKYFIIVNILGASFIATWGVQQHFLGNIRLENMAGGQFSESNSSATLFIMILPIFIYMFLESNKNMKVVATIMAVVFVVAIVFTQSRAALLAMPFVLLTMFFALNVRQKCALFLCCLLFLVVFNFASKDVKNYENRLESVFQETSVESRLKIWRAAFAAFEDHPFTGVGLQNFPFVCNKYLSILGLPENPEGGSDVHNTSLLILTEGGIFPFFFYVFAIIFFFKDSMALKKSLAEHIELKQYWNFPTAIQAGIVSFLVTSMAHSYAYFETFYWLLVTPTIMHNIYKNRLQLIKKQGKKFLGYKGEISDE